MAAPTDNDPRDELVISGLDEIVAVCFGAMTLACGIFVCIVARKTLDLALLLAITVGSAMIVAGARYRGRAHVALAPGSEIGEAAGI